MKSEVLLWSHTLLGRWQIEWWGYASWIIWNNKATRGIDIGQLRIIQYKWED